MNKELVKSRGVVGHVDQAIKRTRSVLLLGVPAARELHAHVRTRVRKKRGASDTPPPRLTLGAPGTERGAPFAWTRGDDAIAMPLEGMKG